MHFPQIPKIENHADAADQIRAPDPDSYRDYRDCGVLRSAIFHLAEYSIPDSV